MTWPSLGHESLQYGIDKFAREAMPIQEEEKSFGETRCKSKTNTETVINKWSGPFS